MRHAVLLPNSTDGGPSGIPHQCNLGSNQEWILWPGGTIRYKPDYAFCVAINARNRLSLTQECETNAVRWVIRD
jgi:hypothetical protein